MSPVVNIYGTIANGDIVKADCFAKGSARYFPKNFNKYIQQFPTRTNCVLADANSIFSRLQKNWNRLDSEILTLDYIPHFIYKKCMDHNLLCYHLILGGHWIVVKCFSFGKPHLLFRFLRRGMSVMLLIIVLLTCVL